MDTSHGAHMHAYMHKHERMHWKERNQNAELIMHVSQSFSNKEGNFLEMFTSNKIIVQSYPINYARKRYRLYDIMIWETVAWQTSYISLFI